MSNGAALTLGPLRLVARWSLRTADHAGRFSFLIVLLVAGFAGAVTSLQTGYQFTGALPLYYAGAVISESMILELGPVLTALILAGRIGARYAAELGTMRVTEQIDALESLGRSASPTGISSTGRATSSDRSTSGTRPSRAAASRRRSRPSPATWASTPSRAPRGWGAPPRRRWCPRRSRS